MQHDLEHKTISTLNTAMKKLTKISFLLILLSVFAFGANAQVNPHAIGLRLGAGDLSGAEVSYQHGLGGNNRLEADLGWAADNDYSAFKFSLNYQFVHPTNWTDGMNWYIGPGGYLGGRSWDDDYPDDADRDGEFFIGANGMIGLEYNFDFPLNLSLDLRPQLELIGDSGELWFDMGLGVRYYW